MEYISICLSCVSSFFIWFSQLDVYFKFGSAVLALFALNTITRFLIMPVLGASAGAVGSDIVKKNRKKQ